MCERRSPSGEGHYFLVSDIYLVLKCCHLSLQFFLAMVLCHIFFLLLLFIMGKKWVFHRQLCGRFPHVDGKGPGQVGSHQVSIWHAHLSFPLLACQTSLLLHGCLISGVLPASPPSLRLQVHPGICQGPCSPDV